ncbi:MAG: 2-C-methyl-D-erythritol 4-phosphate cytidylyltransferase [bacterium]
MRVEAIIAAAGRGTRMRSQVRKPYIPLCGRPILLHTLEKFLFLKPENIIIVVEEEDIGLCRQIVRSDDIRIIAGGLRRQDSVYNGLMRCRGDIVVIHDGVRPFVTQKMIRDSIDAAWKHGAAIAAVPVKDTVKEGRGGAVERTLDRRRLFSVQTPQAFRREVILRAYEYARENNLEGTDDAFFVEASGGAVHIVPGSYDNIKITTPEDLFFAEVIMEHTGLERRV